MIKPLILWGGNDIDSTIYGEPPLVGYIQHPNKHRDRVEIAEYERAVKNKCPIIGICRGAQLVCALNGGKLIQHSIPETFNHDIYTKDGHVLPRVPSAHHQIMVPQGNFELLAWDVGQSKVMHKPGEWGVVENTPEVLWYPEIRAFCVQGHPEWGGVNTPFINWIDRKLKEFEIDFSFNAYNG